MLDMEKFDSAAYPCVFRKTITAGASGVVDMILTGHGFVTLVNIRFAAGENGTLQLRPYVVLPGEIVQDLLRYAADAYITGDDENLKLACYQEIEGNAILRIAYNNTGAGSSQLAVDVSVNYDGYSAPKNIID